MSNKATVILLENNERSLSSFIKALNIYSDEIPNNVRTDTNEIVYWFDRYNKMYEDQLMIFALVYDNQVVGFTQAVYFKTVGFATIDYVAIKKEFREHFASFFNLLIESILMNAQGINFLVTEIDGENKPLERLAKIKGFESLGDYIQPPVSGMEDTEIMAKLLLKRIGSNESYIEPNIVVKTLYFDHYLRWYKPLLTQKEYCAYDARIKSLLKERV